MDTLYKTIIEKVESYNPDRYAASRNYLDGEVSGFSPYISRGVISTHQIFEHLKEIEHKHLRRYEKFIQELAWRDYWQQCWVYLGHKINDDLKQSQNNVSSSNIPTNILNAETEINQINEGIKQLYRTGNIHNHMRMYLAAMICNFGQVHWKTPAKWMYYHLLDGDWASNSLSWQWVAGSNASKKYVFNQDNLNKYSKTNQSSTYIDTAYDNLPLSILPKDLEDNITIDLKTQLPTTKKIKTPKEEANIFTSYNLDPNWNQANNRSNILLLEPTHFDKYPVNEKVMDFILGLSKNINDIQIYVGEFKTLKEMYPSTIFHFKEHPFYNHLVGIEHPRDWMFEVKGYFPSFFSFWKKCKKEISW